MAMVATLNCSIQKIVFLYNQNKHYIGLGFFSEPINPGAFSTTTGGLMTSIMFKVGMNISIVDVVLLRLSRTVVLNSFRYTE